MFFFKVISFAALFFGALIPPAQADPAQYLRGCILQTVDWIQQQTNPRRAIFSVFDTESLARIAAARESVQWVNLSEATQESIIERAQAEVTDERVSELLTIGADTIVFLRGFGRSIDPLYRDQRPRRYVYELDAYYPRGATAANRTYFSVTVRETAGGCSFINLGSRSGVDLANLIQNFVPN